MPLAPVNVLDHVTYHSFSPRWVLNSSGALVSVPNTQLPFMHDAEGNPLGVLIEPESENLFLNSLSMDGLVLTSGVTRQEHAAPYTFDQGSHSLVFSGATKTKSATFTPSEPIEADFIGVSFFIKFEDGSEPILGRSYTRTSHFYIHMNGTEIIDASSQYAFIPLSDGSYWFRGRIKTPYAATNSISIATEPRQIMKNFAITGLQIEKDICSSYMPTDGTPYERSSNFMDGSLSYESTLNKDQSTFEFSYSHLPGSKGGAFSISDASSDVVMDIGNRFDPLETVMVASNTLAERLSLNLRRVEAHPLIGEPERLRMALSKYGIRLSYNSEPIMRLADSNFMDDGNGIPRYVVMGRNLNGETMHGYIRGFNVRARAYRDDELIA